MIVDLSELREHEYARPTAGGISVLNLKDHMECTGRTVAEAQAFLDELRAEYRRVRDEEAKRAEEMAQGVAR